MISRVVLVVAVLLACFLSINAQTDPLTHCAPVTVDGFAVSGTSTTQEGTQELVQVNGTYPTQTYFATLFTSYQQSNIFFRVILSTVNTTGSVGVKFTIALNGVLSAIGGVVQVYSPGASGAVDIEFTNWLFRPNGPINNTLALNVTEVITVGLDVTQCSYVYNINLLNPQPGAPTGGFVTGDPQFVGLRGQSFQVHGVDGAVYNLISDKTMQLNSRFTFLEGPRPCPVMPSTGKPSAACWSHPGSYLSELALKTVGGSKLSVVSGDAATGFSSVTLDGKSLKPGSTAKLVFPTGLSGSISVDNTHELTISAGHFNLVVENNDGFVNLRQVSVPAASWSKLASHGLLGQTWQNKRYSGKIKEIEGDVDDYLIEDDNIFGDSFLYNRFDQ